MSKIAKKIKTQYQVNLTKRDFIKFAVLAAVVFFAFSFEKVQAAASAFNDGGSLAIPSGSIGNVGTIVTTLDPGDNIVIATVQIDRAAGGPAVIAAGNLELCESSDGAICTTLLSETAFQIKQQNDQQTNDGLTYMLVGRKASAPQNPIYLVRAFADVANSNAEVKFLVIQVDADGNSRFSDQAGSTSFISTADTLIHSAALTGLSSGDNIVIAVVHFNSTAGSSFEVLGGGTNTNELRLRRGATQLAFLQNNLEQQRDGDPGDGGYAILIARDPGAPADPTYDVRGSVTVANAAAAEVKILAFNGLDSAMVDTGNVLTGSGLTDIGTVVPGFASGDTVLIGAFQLDNSGGGAQSIPAGSATAGTHLNKVGDAGSAATWNQFLIQTEDNATGKIDDNWSAVVKKVAETGSASYIGRANSTNASAFNAELKMVAVNIKPPAPKLSSAANQTFTITDPATAISTVSVTSTVASQITVANDLRIKINTSTTNFRWDDADTVATISGGASAKVSATVSYAGVTADGADTLIIDVTSDFVANDNIQISGLSFKSFNGMNAATSTLKLFAGGAADAASDAADSKTVAIKGRMQLNAHSAGQEANKFSAGGTVAGAELFSFQLFPQDEPASTTLTVDLSVITGIVTADITSPQIFVDSNVNGAIDAGETTTVFGAGTTSISGSAGTITFTGTTSTVASATSTRYILKATTTNLVAGDTITFSLATSSIAADGQTSKVRLTLTSPTPPANATHNAAAPQISSAANQTFTIGDPATAISAITVSSTDVGQITAANDIRITIATATANFRWDTSDAVATITGLASAKVGAGVTFADASATLVIDVVTDFGASESITISGLSYNAFNGANTATTTLDLKWGGASQVPPFVRDPKTVAIIGGKTSALNHSSGQEPDKFTTTASVTSTELFAFTLAPNGENASVSTTTLFLSAITGIAAADFTNPAIFLDKNRNGNIDASEIAQVGGTGTVNITGSTGTITFSQSYLAYQTSTMDTTKDQTFLDPDNVNGDQFGDSVAIGDVNGDGFSDVLVGCKECDSATASSTGKAFLYFGGPNGIDATVDKTFLSPDNVTFDNFGISVAIGDVNNDGFGDVLVGCFSCNTTSLNTGKAFLYFGATGTTMDTSADKTFSSPDNVINDGFGISLAIGDVNGDGFSDVLVGCGLKFSDIACDNGATADTGKAFLWFGATGTTMDTSTDKTFLGDNVFNDGFGNSVAIGDVNADGFSDVLVGCLLCNSVTASSTGKAFLLFGATGTTMDTSTDKTFLGDNVGSDQFGISVAIGNVNNDGFGDVLVGCRFCDNGATTNTGKAFLLFGATGTTMDTSTDKTFINPDNASSDNFGNSLAIGDVNADGFGDVLVGCELCNNGALNDTGKAFLYFGATGTTMDTSTDKTFLNPDNVFFENFGNSVAIGDVNADAFGDVLAGCLLCNSATASSTGKAFLFQGDTKPQSYILKADVTNLVGGDTITLGFSTSSSFNTGAISGASLGFTGSVTGATHTEDTNLPGTPGTPTYTNVSTSTLTVNWSSSTGVVDFYKIERATGTFVQIGTTTALSFNDSGLIPGTVYQYRARGTNGNGDGPYSASSSVTTAAAAGFAPTSSLTSLIIDTAVTAGVAPNSLFWEGSQPANTTVKFQFAGSNATSGPWTFVGWNSANNTCDAGSFYTVSPATPVEIKAACHQNQRYIRYKVILETTDSAATPQVDRIILNYAQ